MDSKLVAYDLTDAEAWNYEILIKEIESLGAAHLQESVWSVNFDGSSIDLAKRLSGFLRPEDRLQILSYTTNEFFSFNVIDKLQFNEIVKPVDVPYKFDWGSKLTKK